MTVYAVRHGQTSWNADKKIQGKTDISLNDNGRSQALDIAKRLTSMEIDLIITSPLKRAMETADIIAKYLQIEESKIIVGTRLYERDFGDYEGKLISEVDIHALRRWTDDAPTPNGETIREMSSRVFEFLNDFFINTNNEKNILFVVHSHVLRAMYWFFNGLPDEYDETVFETENCGLYEFNDNTKEKEN